MVGSSPVASEWWDAAGVLEEHPNGDVVAIAPVDAVAGETGIEIDAVLFNKAKRERTREKLAEARSRTGGVVFNPVGREVV